MNMKTTRTTSRLRTLIALMTAALLTAVPFRVYAQTVVTQRGVIYTLATDHYEVTGFSLSDAEAAGWERKITIAGDIGGTPVTTVADNAFDALHNADCKQILSLTLGANIKTLGNYAFYMNNGLTSLALNDGLTTVGQYAFSECSALTQLTIPATVTLIQIGAFKNCIALADITMLGTSPAVESTGFYNVGSDANPCLLHVRLNDLSGYLAAMTATARERVFKWTSGDGRMTLQTVSAGLVYTYGAPLEGAYYELTAIDPATVGDLTIGTQGDKPVYGISAPSAVAGLPVTCVGDAAFSLASAVSRMAFIDIRQIPMTSVSVSRSSGVFKGVASTTLIYLNSGSSSEENVVIGGNVATSLNTYVDGTTKSMTSDETTSGRTCWLLNDQWGIQAFGQVTGTAAPLPLSSDRVWQATFRNNTGNETVYRYANTGGTVALPVAAEVGQADPFSLFINHDIDQPFGASTALTADTQIFAYPTVNSVALDITEQTLRMSASQADRTVRPVATVSPAESLSGFNITSSDAAVVSASADGTCVAVGAGTAVVTFASKDNPAATATCTFTVIPKPEKVELSTYDLRLTTVGATAQLSATVLPAGSIQDVVWESTDETICTVDATGLVTAVAPGKAYINCYPTDGMSMYSICYVTVGAAVSGISLSDSNVSLMAGSTKTLTATMQPSDAITGIKWTSSDEAVATVSKGVVTAVAAGEATITAIPTDYPSYSATCRIRVFEKSKTTSLDGLNYQITDVSGTTGKAQLVSIPADRLTAGGMIVVPEKLDVPGMDISVSDIAADAIGTVTNNTLVYLPKGAAYSGHADNVIRLADSGNTCERLVLTDGKDYSTMYSFTAQTLVYQRTLEGGVKPYAVCLPYSMNSTANLRFYRFDHADDTHLVLYEVDGATVPYMPYLVIARQTVSDLGGTNVTMPTYGSNTDCYDGDFGLIGTMKQIDAAEAAGMHANNLVDGKWEPVTASGSGIAAMRSWLWTPQGQTVQMTFAPVPELPDPFDYSTVTDDGTAIQSVEADGQAHRYYDLQGRYVGTSLDIAPKGVYILDGRKIVKR